MKKHCFTKLFFSTMFILTFCLFLSIPDIALAAADALVSNGNGNWGDDSSWDVNSDTNTHHVPDSDDTVTISAGHTITLDTYGTCVSLTINTSGGLTFGNGNDLTVLGAVTSDGHITINSASGASIFSISGTLSITSHGSLTMIPSGAGSSAQISCDSLSLTSTTCALGPSSSASATINTSTSSGCTLTGSSITLTPSGSGTSATLNFSGGSVSIDVNSSINVTPTNSASASYTSGLTSVAGIASPLVRGTLKLETNTSASITASLKVTNSGNCTFKTNASGDSISVTNTDYITNSSPGILTIQGYSASFRNVSVTGGYIYSTATTLIKYAVLSNLGGYNSGDVTQWGLTFSGIEGYNNYGIVQVDGCEISNCWAGITLSGCNHITNWFSNYVKNNTIHDCAYAGIYLTNTNRTEILNNTCYNNIGANTGYGIHLSGSSMNTINNSALYGNKYFNLYFTSSDKNMVENNTIYSCATQDGFYMLSSNYNVLIGNSAYSNSVHGIALEQSSNNVLVKNRSYENEKSGLRFRMNSNSNVCLGNYNYKNTEAGLNSYQSQYNLCIDDTYGHDGATVQANTLGDVLIEGDSNQGQISQVWLRNCLLSSPNEVADTSGKQEFTKTGSWIYSQKHDQENGLTKLYGMFSLPVTNQIQGDKSQSGLVNQMQFNYANTTYPAFTTTPFLRFDYNSACPISAVTFSSTTEAECWIVTYDTGAHNGNPANRWYVRGTTSGIQNNVVVPDGTTYNSDGVVPKVTFRITQTTTPNEYGIQYVFITGRSSNDTNTQKKIQLADFQDDLGHYIGAKFTADSGSTLEMEGNSSVPTLVDHKNRDGGSDFYYGFELKGTTNKLNYTTFKYLNENGLVMNTAPAANTTGLTIQNVKTGGTHLMLGGITHTFDNINLDNSGVYNSSGTATATFRDYTRYNLPDVSATNANWDPTLTWTGETGFSDDGVSPNDALTNSNFEFRIKYTDLGVASGGDAPAAIQVWVDANDNGTFESSEKHDLTKVTEAGINDNNYTNGEIYSYTYNGMTFAGNGSINYRFYATNPNSTTMIATTANHEATGIGHTADGLGTPVNGSAYLSISGSAPQTAITTPIGEQSGEVTITYILIDAESNTCAIKCEFSQDGGATWATATKGTGGDSVTGLLSSPAPAGSAHIFVWNTKTDLPNKRATVNLRITPSDVIGAGTAGTTDSFVVVNTASATQSTVICSPTAIPADGAIKTTITITLKDPTGNAVADKTVEIRSTGSNNTITQPTAKSDGNGQTIAYLASTKAEQKTITAKVVEDAFDLQQQPAVTFTALAVDANVSTITYAPSEIIADGTSKATITVTLLDRYSNPVPGKDISLSVSGSENILTQPAAVTNANGQASGALASTKMESKIITAKDDTDNIILSNKVTIVFIPAKGLAVDSTTLIPGDPTKQNVSIFYSNPEQKIGTIKIFNLTGALILEKDLAPGNVATWDGKDSDGDMVETGIYIYQLDIDGSIKNGAIAVVK